MDITLVFGTNIRGSNPCGRTRIMKSRRKIAAIIPLVAALTACTDRSTGSAPANESTIESGPEIAQPVENSQSNSPDTEDVIPAENCEYSKVNPQEPTKSGEFLVYATCYLDPDAPVGVYDEPSQLPPSQALGTLPHGATITPDCFVEDQGIQDGAGQDGITNSGDPHESAIWVLAESDEVPEKFYIPDVWVGFSGGAFLEPC